MNAKPAFIDQTVDFVDPRGAGIVGLQSAADCVATLDNCERDGVKSGSNSTSNGQLMKTFVAYCRRQ